MMKTSSLIISLLLCLTVAMAQDNQDQDELPDGDQALAEESESDLTESQKDLENIVRFVFGVLDNQDQEDLPDGDQALAEESDLKKKFVAKFVSFAVIGLAAVLIHFLKISIANLLQISFSTFNLVNVPLVGNVILTNDYRCGR